MKELFDHQSSLLIREICRLRPGPSQTNSPEKVVPPIEDLISVDLDRDMKTIALSTEPDEPQPVKQDDEFGELPELPPQPPQQERSSLMSIFSNRTTTTTQQTVRNTAQSVQMARTETNVSMVPMKPGVSEMVVQSSTTQSQQASRYTFVGQQLLKHKENATKAALERGYSAVNIARRVSQFQPHVDQSNATSPYLYELVTSRSFMYVMMAVILLNLILLGIEVELSAAAPLSEQRKLFFFGSNIVIVFVYALEMILKLFAFGCTGFFLGTDRAWNMFDFSITTLSVIESMGDIVTTASANVESSFFRVVRFVRLARALRGIRVIRLIHYVGALRTLVFAIASTAGSLVWTLLLLILIFYIFGVIFAQIVVDNCVLHGQTCDNENLALYWNGVGTSMVTLFMVVSGGVNWEDIYRPLREISSIAVVGLVIYIIISVFAILNVVTGVFCNTAIESAHADRDIAIMKQLVKKRNQVSALKEIFQEIDQNKAEVVNILDLKAALDGKKLSSFMESLGINTEDIWTLFMIIDADESGEITIDEFVSGCMQLHGPAKSLQLAKMSFENKVTRQEIKRLSKQVAAIVKYFDLEKHVRTSSSCSRLF